MTDEYEIPEGDVELLDAAARHGKFGVTLKKMARQWDEEAHELTVRATVRYDEGRHAAGERLVTRAQAFRQAALELHNTIKGTP